MQEREKARATFGGKRGQEKIKSMRKAATYVYAILLLAFLRPLTTVTRLQVCSWGSG